MSHYFKRAQVVVTYNQTPVLSYRNELSLWHYITQFFVSIVWENLVEVVPLCLIATNSRYDIPPQHISFRLLCLRKTWFRPFHHTQLSGLHNYPRACGAALTCCRAIRRNLAWTVWRRYEFHLGKMIVQFYLDEDIILHHTEECAIDHCC